MQLLETLGGDEAIKAIIVSTSFSGLSAAFEKLREAREDIFLVYYSIPDDADTKTPDLILNLDFSGIGSALVEQAYKLGAQTMVYYAFPMVFERYPHIKKRYEMIKQKCSELGVAFVEVMIPNPLEDHSGPSEQEIIARDIPQKVAQYGKDTAFFAEPPLPEYMVLEAVIDNGAIFPGASIPAPISAFDRAVFGVYIFDDGYEANPTTYEDAGYTMETVEAFMARTWEALAEKEMLGRVST
jgi:hypothetical protein